MEDTESVVLAAFIPPGVNACFESDRDRVNISILDNDGKVQGDCTFMLHCFVSC